MRRAHIIERQVLHVDLVGGERDALELNRRLSTLCNGPLLRALEEVLDRFAPEDGDLVIPTLEIDLGTISFDGVEHELTGAVVLALDETLRRRIADDVVRPGPMQHRTGPRAAVDALVHFIRTGRLPWWYRIAANESLESTVLTALRADAGALRDRAHEIATILASSSQSRRRVVLQFSRNFRLTMIAALALPLHRTVEKVLTSWWRSTASDELARAFEESIWIAALERTSASDDVSPEALVARAYRALPSTLRARRDVHAALAANWPSAVLDAGSEPSSVHAGDEHPELAGSDDDELHDGVFVDNAGLVLLHPFLPRFFSYLGIADDEHILDADRAVALAHYLATGSEVAPEHDLVVAKILCGVPLDEPVTRDVELKATERDEATALLEAVIGHWSALRSTSPDGLRTSFLMRPGKISVDSNDEWRVQVESQTYDILLDHLPWGIAMFKLPWMQRACRVEWGS